MIQYEENIQIIVMLQVVIDIKIQLVHINIWEIQEIDKEMKEVDKRGLEGCILSVDTSLLCCLLHLSKRVELFVSG